MTREEIEHLASFKPPAFMTEAEIWYNKGLLEGLRTADKNPKCKWISVEDDLPYKHKELIGVDCLETVSVFAVVQDIKNNRTMYMPSIMVKLSKSYGEWKWEWFCDSKELKVTHWMPIPELPKE